MGNMNTDKNKRANVKRFTWRYIEKITDSHLLLPRQVSKRTVIYICENAYNFFHKL